MITSTHISSDLRIFATASLDGKIHLYTLSTGKLLRTFFHPKSLPMNQIILSSCPLPCLLFFSQENHTLYSYSINGQFLARYKEKSENILSPILIKDRFFMEHLAYGIETGRIVILELPFLW